MIQITTPIYEAIADMLIERIGDADYFNGTVEYDTEELYSSLTCTLIVCRNPVTQRIYSILPVWWEYNTDLCDGSQLNDFSWSELDRYIQSRF